MQTSTECLPALRMYGVREVMYVCYVGRVQVVIRRMNASASSRYCVIIVHDKGDSIYARSHVLSGRAPNRDVLDAELAEYGAHVSRKCRERRGALQSA